MQVKYHFGIERKEIRFITRIITKNIYSCAVYVIISNIKKNKNSKKTSPLFYERNGNAFRRLKKKVKNK